MKITTTGIDLAKNVFQVHGVNECGRAALKKQLKRAQVLPFFANLPPCLIGMEACASAHYWARKLSALGHTVKLMAPQYVKPYVKTNKHDVADAEAICEAVGRPNMRFVAIKTAEQQAILALHRARQSLVKARTAQANQIRGLLGEFGIIIPQGMAHIAKRLPEILEDGENELPGSFRQLLARLGENLEHLQRQVAELEREIQRWHQDSEASQRVAAISGIGALGASALVATVGEAKSFSSGRQLAAWLGMVPKQASSGGKTTLLGISKRGDSYLRTLFIHGARSVVQQAERHPERADPWLKQLLGRRPKNVVAVALANKNARIAWALLAHGRDYQPRHAPLKA
ncbi:MAG TPA: IS110 family transposase [Casimicrobiaceae bacterium]